MVGHIKIDRKILNWEWYTDHKVFHLFLYLLLKANHKDGNWKGVNIKRGQLITGRLKVSKDTGLSERVIRTCLNKLKTTNEIAIKATSKYSVITICKYDVYQSFNNTNDQHIDQQTVQSLTNKRPTNDQQTTINNNVNNNKEDINRDIPKGEIPLFTPQFYPTKEKYNGLPQLTFENVYRLVRATKNIEIEKEVADSLWEVFKQQNLTGGKPYKDDADVYRHFENWANKQSFRKKATPKEIKEKVNIVGEEFINDFKQVRMSDGSIKDLTINQMDSARFNQINPNSIKNK